MGHEEENMFIEVRSCCMKWGSSNTDWHIIIPRDMGSLTHKFTVDPKHCMIVHVPYIIIGAYIDSHNYVIMCTHIFIPQCDPAGRNAADSEKVLIVQDVKQIGEDPLIVFDGI